MEYGEDLNVILKEICLQLNKKNLQFCLAGGWAVSMLGIARTTIDIDLLVVLDENTREQIVSILKSAFHLIQSHEDEMEFKHMSIWRNIVSLKNKKDPFMIDLINADNDYLKSVIQRKTEIDHEGVVVPVIAVEDLIVLKMFSFRKQDQVDIENLVQTGTPVDWTYLEKIIKQFKLDWDYIEKIK
jgi:predicted nucleotidyltransferase